MKEVKSYKCDFCGTVYATESECKKCEEYHCKPIKITNMKYNKTHKYDSYNCYPDSITVIMSDGAVVEFSRNGIFKNTNTFMVER